MTKLPKLSFEEEARRKRNGLVRELWDFLRSNKKWWLLPLLIALLVLSIFAVFAASGAAPFIYTIF